MQNITTPILNELTRSSLKSFVSVHVGVSSVSWTAFALLPDRPTVVTNWNHSDMDEKKLHLSELIEIVSKIIFSIPEADLYILESPQTAQAQAPGSPTQININIQKSQLIGMVSLALANRVYNARRTKNLESKSDVDVKIIDTLQQAPLQQPVLFMRQFTASR